jgi:hypothetical protein
MFASYIKSDSETDVGNPSSASAVRKTRKYESAGVKIGHKTPRERCVVAV